MCCDIFNFPLTEDSATQSSLLGGAKLALECLGESLDINDIFVNSGTLLTPMKRLFPFINNGMRTIFTGMRKLKS
jgi:hypothetical protein